MSGGPLLEHDAGAGFLYIALCDLIPALHQHSSRRDMVIQTGLMVAGALLIVLTHAYLG
jgi:zinc transporter ZupT